MGKNVHRALRKAALGGSIGPVPKSHKITGEFRDPSERPHGQPWLRPWYMSPRKTEEAAGTRREDTRPPIVPRVHSIAGMADGGPVAADELGSDPIELERLRVMNRGTTDPATMAANAETNRAFVLDNTPVVGNVRSAGRALDAGSDLITAKHYGHTGKARRAALALALETAGALSPLPWGRSAGRVAAEGADAARIFAGPLAKTADHAALARAKEMVEAGADRADIWRETGWFRGVDGKWRFEIPDNEAQLDLSGLKPSASPYMPSTNEGALGDVLQHPALFEAYPAMRNIDVTHSPNAKGVGSAFYQPPDSGLPGSISITGGSRKPLSSTLHEGQHDVQFYEQTSAGGSMSAAYPADGKGGAWPIYRERIKNVTTPITIEKYAKMVGFDDIDDARASYANYLADIDSMRRKGIPAHVDRVAQESAAQDWYMSLAGEVEARNVQARQHMTPEQRRATPPWETQDTPDDMQILRDPLRAGQQDVLIPARESKGTVLAREMRAEGVPLDTIHRKTSRVIGPEGAVKYEINDQGMRLRPDLRAGDELPLNKALIHPELFAAEPALGKRMVRVTDNYDRAGMPVSRTDVDGNLEINPAGDPRGQLAKLLQYEINRDAGYGQPLRHGATALERGLDRAREQADRLDAPNRDVIDAYLDQLADVRDAYDLRRSLEQFQKKGPVSDAVLRSVHRNAGNLEGRVAAARATATPEDLRLWPYRRNAIPHTGRGPAFDDIFSLPPDDLTDPQMLEFIRRWGQFGSGRGKFARGGRVKRKALAKAARLTLGGVRGKTGGRADKLPVDVPAGAYVIPADVVAALGDGNTEAGMARLDKQFSAARGYAAGGRAEAVPIQISDGEFVVSPAAVAALGGGDEGYGHEVLDEFVTQTRAAYADHLQNLPGPQQ